MTRDPRRSVPRTDTVLADPRLARARLRLGDRRVKEAVRAAQLRVRTGDIVPDDLLDAVLAELPETASSLHEVLNATGVVLHTNLGRAPLSAAAVAALVAAAGYVDVEFDLGTGQRARRGRGAVAALLAAVPDAGDALLVNNGAAALVLTATALAQDREILVSRGELVEIGDGFRIPELLASTGARLREVGTTNRTHLADYADAVGERTAFVLKVHPSNFAIRGFTSSVPVSQLSGLGVPVVADIGSGLLEPEPGLPDEPDASTWLRAGAALVTASGDKLLGGPQAGLLVGRSDLVAVLRRHPLYRALRVDKLTLAALEATLTGPPTPTRVALCTDAAVLRSRAEKVVESLRAQGVTSHVSACDGRVGGGGAPELVLPGWAVVLPSRYAQALRRTRPAVVARIDHGRCLLDLRGVPIEDDARLVTVIVAAGRAAGPADEERSCT